MRSRKVDDAQAAIVEALNRCGCVVWDLSGVGRGVSDLVVLFRGAWHAIEIKSGEKNRKRLTKRQKEMHAKCAGHIHVVTTVDEALMAIGAIRVPRRA